MEFKVAWIWISYVVIVSNWKMLEVQHELVIFMQLHKINDLVIADL